MALFDPGIVNGIVPKRRITQDKIEVIVRHRGLFETLIENLRVRIEVLQYALGDRIEFDGHALCFGHDLRWHHAEEMADARSWFEQAKRVESADPQIIESFVNHADNRKRGVVSVERAR